MLAVFAWPEPPSVTRGELSADVRDGMEAPAFGGTEFPTGGLGYARQRGEKASRDFRVAAAPLALAE